MLGNSPNLPPQSTNKMVPPIMAGHLFSLAFLDILDNHNYTPIHRIKDQHWNVRSNRGLDVELKHN